MGYDRKYGIVSTQFGNIGADEPVVVFRAQDVTLPAVLLSAAQKAMKAGSPARHVEIFHAYPVETHSRKNLLDVEVMYETRLG